MTTQRLQARYRESNGLLVGALLGIATVVVGASWFLQGSDLWWDRYLMISIGLVAILRSRVFSRIQHLVPLRAAGTIVLLLEFLSLVQEYDEMRTWMVLILVAAAVALVGVSSLGMSDVTRARIKRTLNIVEFLVVIEMIVMMAGAMGVFEKFGGLM